MRLDSEHDTMLQAMADSLAIAVPKRLVVRGFHVHADFSAEQLQQGVLCVLARGGGNWLNYQGREGELGTLRFNLVGLVQVAEDSDKVEVEQAELALLQDVLEWIRLRKAPPLDMVYPGDFTQSMGMEHPYGWFSLAAEARFV
jgi:hypothetical protein